MLRILFIVFFLSVISFPQSAEGLRCTVYPILPTIVGGIDSLHLRLYYPKEAKQNNIEGNVYVIADLDTLGNLISTRVIKGIGYGCDKEAVRLIESSQFTPAYAFKTLKPVITYKPINSEIAIKISFKLK